MAGAPPYGYYYPGYYPPPTLSAPKPPDAAKPPFFDGKDPETLYDYFAKILTIFMQSLHHYPSGQSKVLYAASFLKEAPALWFNTNLAMQPLPSICTDWDTFVRELNRMFGDRNRVKTAQQALRELRMSDEHQVQHYIIEFSRWAPITGFNEPALIRDFYHGLPRRIKDDFKVDAEGVDLTRLRDLALVHDQRYWERQHELREDGLPYARPKPFPGYKPAVTTRTQGLSGESRSAPASSGSGNPSSRTGSSAPLRAPSTPSVAPRSDGNSGRTRLRPQNRRGERTGDSSDSSSVAARLTQEGRLTAAERDRRLREGRCLYCASLEHRYVDCPKNTRSTVNHPGGSSSSTPPANSGAGRAGRSQRPPGVPATSNNNNNGNQSYGRATFTISAPSDETPAAPPASSPGNAPATQN